MIGSIATAISSVVRVVEGRRSRPLKNGRYLEPDGSPIAATYSAEGLAKLIPAAEPHAGLS
jgi:hypothetical protein